MTTKGGRTDDEIREVFARWKHGVGWRLGGNPHYSPRAYRRCPTCRRWFRRGYAWTQHHKAYGGD